MAINFLNNIDLNKNELQNVKIHVLSTAPASPVEGQMYYNSTDNKLYFFDGSSFVDASGDIKSVATSTSTTLTITDSTGPNPSIATVTGAVTNGGTALATGDQIYDFVIAQIGGTSITVNGTTNEIEVTDGGTVNNGDTVTIGLPNDVTIGNNLAVTNDVTVTGDLTVNGTTTTVNSNTVTVDDPVFTLGGDTAPASDDNKDRGIEFRYHDGSSAKLGFFGYDDSTDKFTFLTSATNSSEVFSGTKGNLDITGLDLSGSITSIDGAAPTDGQLLVGNTSAGDMELATLTAGEAIGITNAAGAITVAAEDATESNKGVVELATTAEALTGTDTSRAVTPAGLAARSFSANIGDGSATSIVVTHSLNTRDVVIQLYDNSSFDTVYADVVRTTVDTATITFTAAPASNDIRVLVTKID
tara:strand:+ start:742 stop:1986 length:1245 start_codon:yes stop_codon:yes gene_type:complete